MQLHIEVLSSASLLAICTAVAPGLHGDDVAGMQGCGVNTPIAADVAAATCGFDGLYAHAERPDVERRDVVLDGRLGLLAGRGTIERQYQSTAGLLPKVQANCAPLTT